MAPIGRTGDYQVDRSGRELIEKVEGDMLLMSSGCLCCTIRGDLITTLEDLLRRRDNGRITPFRRVIIETTGLADPAPVLQTILGHRYLALRYGSTIHGFQYRDAQRARGKHRGLIGGIDLHGG